MALKIKDDPEKEIIEIEGLRFSHDFFKFFATGKIGTPFKLEDRKDGVINISEDIPPIELDKIPALHGFPPDPLILFTDAKKYIALYENGTIYLEKCIPRKPLFDISKLINDILQD